MLSVFSFFPPCCESSHVFFLFVLEALARRLSEAGRAGWRRETAPLRTSAGPWQNHILRTRSCRIRSAVDCRGHKDPWIALDPRTRLVRVKDTEQTDESQTQWLASLNVTVTFHELSVSIARNIRRTGSLSGSRPRGFIRMDAARHCCLAQGSHQTIGLRLERTTIWTSAVFDPGVHFLPAGFYNGGTMPESRDAGDELSAQCGCCPASPAMDPETAPEVLPLLGNTRATLLAHGAPINMLALIDLRDSETCNFDNRPWISDFLCHPFFLSRGTLDCRILAKWISPAHGCELSPNDGILICS